MGIYSRPVLLHREVSSEISEDFTKERMDNRKINMMANEIRNKIEQQDTCKHIERGHVQADGRDGGCMGRCGWCTFEEVDGGEGFDGGVSVSEAGPHTSVEDESGIRHVVVVESYEGGYSELQPMDTVL